MGQGWNLEFTEAGILLFPGKIPKFPGTYPNFQEWYPNFQDPTRISRNLPEFPGLHRHFQENYPNFQVERNLLRSDAYTSFGASARSCSRPAPTGPVRPRPAPYPASAAARCSSGRLQNFQESVPKFPGTHTQISRNIYPNFHKTQLSFQKR